MAKILRLRGSQYEFQMMFSVKELTRHSLLACTWPTRERVADASTLSRESQYFLAEYTQLRRKGIFCRWELLGYSLLVRPESQNGYNSEIKKCTFIRFKLKIFKGQNSS